MAGTERLLSKPARRFAIPAVMVRAFDVVAVVVLVGAMSFLIVVTNSLLLGKANFVQAFEAWWAFVRRPDILATIGLTAIVATAYLVRRHARRS